MSKDSIDREVAEKVMGWPIHSHGPMSAYLVGPDRLRWPSDWSPSTRIDHAWEVVEQMRAKGWQVSISSPDPWGDDGPNIWGCDFFCDSLISGKAGTAPLAICRAALEAVKPQ